MFCIYCGTEIPDRSKYCLECGKSVPIKIQLIKTEPITEEILKKQVSIYWPEGYKPCNSCTIIDIHIDGQPVSSVLYGQSMSYSIPIGEHQFIFSVGINPYRYVFNLDIQDHMIITLKFDKTGTRMSMIPESI